MKLAIKATAMRTTLSSYTRMNTDLTMSRSCSQHRRKSVVFINREGSITLHRSDRKQYNAPSTGDVKPPLLHMTSGQQGFLKSAQRVANSLAPGRSGNVKKCS